MGCILPLGLCIRVGQILHKSKHKIAFFLHKSKHKSAEFCNKSKHKSAKSYRISITNWLVETHGRASLRDVCGMIIYYLFVQKLFVHLR